MTIAVFHESYRPLLEAQLPAHITPRWFSNREELYALAPEAEIGWFDGLTLDDMWGSAHVAKKIRWLNTNGAGVENFPLAQLRELGAVMTNGAGLTGPAIAEFVVLGVLNFAKGFADIVRAHDRREWLTSTPPADELTGSRALVLGAGGIGSETGKRLAALGVEVTYLRRNPGPGDLGPDQWRARLGEFDWIVVTVPATPDTDKMIGAAELGAMKPNAVILNVSRGAVIDQDALVEALREQRIRGAFLDVTSPEPLPADHPLWGLDNCLITMHLSGRSTTPRAPVAAARFLENLGRFERGEPLLNQVDLVAGY